MFELQLKYRNGRGKWQTNAEVTSAFESAYAVLIRRFEPTGNRICVVVDLVGPFMMDVGLSPIICHLAACKAILDTGPKVGNLLGSVD